MLWSETLIDGHNRYNICRKHNISFNTVKIEFESREHAMIWMLKNQGDRRNLTPEELVYMRGKQYELEKIVEPRNQYTTRDVMKELNSNRYLSDEDKNIDPNIIQVKHLDDRITKITIKFDLSESLLDDILNRSVRRSNYITLFGMVYALQLLKGKEQDEAVDEAHNILYRCKIYTLDERNEIMREEETNKIVSDIKSINSDKSKLPENEILYYNKLRQLVNLLETIKDNNVDYLVSIIFQLVQNLKNRKTLNMCLALMGMPLKLLEDIPAKEQIEIYKEIRQLIEKRVKEKMKIENIDIIPFDK